MSITIDETSLFETLLSYALYAGAVFQLICVFAVMFSPEDDFESQQSKKEVLTSRADRLSSSSAFRSQEQTTFNRKGKREKKKHR